MPLSKPFVAALSVLALTACPAPPDSGGQGRPGQPGPSPGVPGQQASPPSDRGANPSGDNPMPAMDRDLSPTETAGLPTFKALIDTGAETLTIKGKVSGVAKGQVDFQIANKVGDWTVPRVVHSSEVVDGSFSVKAPVDYTVPVYVVVVNDANGNGPDPSDAMLYHPDVLSIGSEDISLEISTKDAPSWLTEVFSDLPDPESGANIIKDGEPPNAQVLTPDNPVPDGIGDLPPGSIPENNVVPQAAPESE